jgi:hypothetical protein
MHHEKKEEIGYFYPRIQYKTEMTLREEQNLLCSLFSLYNKVSPFAVQPSGPCHRVGFSVIFLDHPLEAFI